MSSPAPTESANQPTNETIQIHLIGLESLLEHIEISPNATGQDVVTSIIAASNIPNESILTVLFAGKLLQADTTVTEQGLCSGSQLLVLVHEDAVTINIEDEPKEDEKTQADSKENDDTESESSEPAPRLEELSDDSDESELVQSPQQEQSNTSPETNPLIAPQLGQEPVPTDAPDMISLECTEPRFSMMCKDETSDHGLTQSSLLAYLQHKVLEREHEIRCPKCGALWDYAFLRRVLNGHEGFTHEIRMEIERKLSANVVSKRMNAKRCMGCSLALRRSVFNKSFAASCVGCHVSFCWACFRPWKDGAVTCANIKCPSWVREVTCTVLRTCPTKHIDHMDDVPVLRACPICGQLITHISDCKHMDCPICHRSFCFICILPADKEGNYKCGYDAASCPLAGRQTKDDVVLTGLRSYSSILGPIDLDSMEVNSNPGEGDAQDITDEMSSMEFYEKFAADLLENLESAGWDEEYDSE